MKRWKKYTSLLLALPLVLCLSLTACGGGNGSVGEVEDDEDTAPATINNLVTDTSIEYDYSALMGTWTGEDDSVLIMEHVEDITNSERFLLSDADNELLASGNIQYVEEYGYVYLYNEHDGIAHICWFNEDDTLYIDSFGTFTKVSGDVPGETIGDDDDGRGDLVPDDGDSVPVLMSGALPFTNIETLQSENHEDGTYYFADVMEDGQIIVVNTVLLRDLVDDAQTLEEYLTGCALSLGEADTCLLQTVEKNSVYTEKMSYPVYIVTYTVGRNEDTREWTVFAMDTDRYTYLYGFCTTLDAADDMKSVYQDIFAGLYMSDGK